MKLMIFIISLFLFLSCGNKGSNIGHNIELTITPSMQKNASSTVVLSLLAPSAMIDWGDGTEIEYTLPMKKDHKGMSIFEKVSHNYSDPGKSYTIKVRTTDLIAIDLDSMRLQKLKIGKCTQLKVFKARGLGINYLDFSGCSELVNLYLGNNNITSLNLSENPMIEHLDLSNNRLTSLNVSKSPNLRYLDCNNNKLTAIDLSNNLSLSTLYISKNSLSMLDISKNTALISLSCNENPLKSLDLNNNNRLSSLYCMKTQVSSVNISDFNNLITVFLEDNQLGEEVEITVKETPIRQSKLTPWKVFV
ncbi:MAG: leucine-rich repeat domain-containing protein [Dysgonomonas sp.]|uniref:leucine-rich repeat domain-containing protein n=1 Tax=Dysgonomonas sp. TaxID=1891233 RepID=UPI003A877C65